MNQIFFKNTRNGDQRVSAPEAVFQGAPEGGGLFVPDRIPELPFEPGKTPRLSYRDLTEEILFAWMPGFGRDALRRVVKNGYGNGKFSIPDLVDVATVGDHHFIELFHGPTLAFKDIALSLLPHLFAEARRQAGKANRMLVVAATSGDTGPAVIEGFKNSPDCKVVIFYPEGGTSCVQERQMICAGGSHIHVVAVDGNFDEAQDMLKQLLKSEDMREVLDAFHYSGAPANSINIGRLVPQIAYYFYAYELLVRRGMMLPGYPVNIAVPTGNFGNLLAAWYAGEMGLPVNRFICASNRNNVLSDFIRTGEYDARREFHQSSSPSMDILISGNLERLLYHLSSGETALVRQMMESLESDRKYKVPARIKTALDQQFSGGYATDEECRSAIRICFERHGYLMDPHTAVAFKVTQDYIEQTKDEVPVLIAATASPFKFPGTVYEAITGQAVHDISTAELLSRLCDEVGCSIPPQLEGIDEWPVYHSRSCTVIEMGKLLVSAVSGV